MGAEKKLSDPLVIKGPKEKKPEVSAGKEGGLSE